MKGLLSGTLAVGLALSVAAPSPVNGNKPEKKEPEVPPFATVVEQHFQKWDKDKDGKLSFEETAAVICSPHVKGTEAAAVAAIHWYQREAKADSRAVDLRFLRDPGKAHPGEKDPKFGANYRERLARIKNTSHQLFEGDAPNLDGMHQGGGGGDCYLIASIGALVARDPAEVRKMFIPGKDGACEIQFPNGPKVHVRRFTDGEIALTSTCKGQGIWLNVLQKAYGMALLELEGEHGKKMEAIDRTRHGGLPRRAVALLTGCRVDHIPTGLSQIRKGGDSSNQEKRLREALDSAAREHRLMACCTPGKDLASTPGITPSHCYAILRYDTRHDMLHLWNPHGSSHKPKGPAGLENGYVQQAGRLELPLRDFVRIFSSACWQTSTPLERTK